MQVWVWRNLHYNKDKQLCIIDFQDLTHGPIGIDLAGIFIDHYYPIHKKEILNKLKTEYGLMNSKHLMPAAPAMGLDDEDEQYGETKIMKFKNKFSYLVIYLQLSNKIPYF